LIDILPDTATQRQVIDFYYHHDLAKISITSMSLAANHMMSLFACDCCPNVTPNFGCYNFALEKGLFSDRLALIFSVIK